MIPRVIEGSVSNSDVGSVYYEFDRYTRQMSLTFSLPRLEDVGIAEFNDVIPIQKIVAEVFEMGREYKIHMELFLEEGEEPESWLQKKLDQVFVAR